MKLDIEMKLQSFAFIFICRQNHQNYQVCSPLCGPWMVRTKAKMLKKGPPTKCRMSSLAPRSRGAQSKQIFWKYLLVTMYSAEQKVFTFLGITSKQQSILHILYTCMLLLNLFFVLHIIWYKQMFWISTLNVAINILCKTSQIPCESISKLNYSYTHVTYSCFRVSLN